MTVVISADKVDWIVRWVSWKFETRQPTWRVSVPHTALLLSMCNPVAIWHNCLVFLKAPLRQQASCVPFSRPFWPIYFACPKRAWECGVTPWYILGNVSYWQLTDLFCCRQTHSSALAAECWYLVFCLLYIIIGRCCVTKCSSSADDHPGEIDSCLP